MLTSNVTSLDQETAMHDQGENYNPENDLRDYEAVANLLPVFCVSSREYQRKCGRIASQAEDDGFVTLEDTEIPQLLEHAKKSTNVSRARNCKKFLNNAIQIWQSLQLWASDTTTGEALTEEQMTAHASALDQDLENLRKVCPQPGVVGYHAQLILCRLSRMPQPALPGNARIS